MKRKFLKQALGLVICLSMVCPQVMVSAAPLQEMNEKTIQAEVQSTSDDGNEQVTKVAEGLVTALIDGKAAEGESFQAAIEAAGIDAADVTTIEFQSGNVTSEDLAYIKANCKELESFKLNLSETLKFDEGSTVLPSNAFKNMESLETVELGGFTELGSYSFEETKSLANVSIPDVVKVGPYAFRQADYDADTGKGVALKSIDLPNVVTISNYAFSSCDALTEVNMPKVKSIDSTTVPRLSVLLRRRLIKLSTSR